MHAIEYYSAIKTKKNVALATMHMNLKDIILTEINQSQKDK